MVDMLRNHIENFHSSGAVNLVQKLFPTLGKQETNVMPFSACITAVVILGSSVRTWLMLGL